MHSSATCRSWSFSAAWDRASSTSSLSRRICSSRAWSSERSCGTYGSVEASASARRALICDSRCWRAARSASRVAICALRRVEGGAQVHAFAIENFAALLALREHGFSASIRVRAWIFLERGDAIRARNNWSSSSGRSALCTPSRSFAVCSDSRCAASCSRSWAVSALARATATPRSASAMRARSLSSSMRRSAVASALRSSSMSGGEGGRTELRPAPMRRVPARPRMPARTPARAWEPPRVWRPSLGTWAPTTPSGASRACRCDRCRRPAWGPAISPASAGWLRRRRMPSASAHPSAEPTNRCARWNRSAWTRTRQRPGRAIQPWLHCRRPTVTRWYSPEASRISPILRILRGF